MFKKIIIKVIPIIVHCTMDNVQYAYVGKYIEGEITPVIVVITIIISISMLIKM